MKGCGADGNAGEADDEMSEVQRSDEASGDGGIDSPGGKG